VNASATEEAGDQAYVDDWLAEFSSVDTLVQVDVHELTDDELEAWGRQQK
jgi:hypothetical protein